MNQLLGKQWTRGHTIFVECADKDVERFALLLRIFLFPCVEEGDQRLVTLDLRLPLLFWRLLMFIC